MRRSNCPCPAMPWQLRPWLPCPCPGWARPGRTGRVVDGNVVIHPARFDGAAVQLRVCAADAPVGVGRGQFTPLRRWVNRPAERWTHRSDRPSRDPSSSRPPASGGLKAGKAGQARGARARQQYPRRRRPEPDEPGTAYPTPSWTVQRRANSVPPEATLNFMSRVDPSAGCHDATAQASSQQYRCIAPRSSSPSRFTAWRWRR
jgi:hypothetical protein